MSLKKKRKKFPGWIEGRRKNIPWLDRKAESEDLKVSDVGLRSMIHEDGDPEPPSDQS